MAAISGDTKYTLASFVPERPLKLRLIVLNEIPFRAVLDPFQYTVHNHIQESLLQLEPYQLMLHFVKASQEIELDPGAITKET